VEFAVLSLQSGKPVYTEPAEKEIESLVETEKQKQKEAQK
jgi:hypothetical protein